MTSKHPEFKKPMPLVEKLSRAVFRHGNYAIIEMPPDPEFLYHEGVAMEHCLEFCYREYAERMKTGAQRQFSLINLLDGRPCVNIELSLTRSSYSGPVTEEVITQIRGKRNQCPPNDRYLPTIMEFMKHSGFKFVNHGVQNFDGQCDGQLVLDRWLEIQESN
jgi:hypothetical protein